MAKKSKRSIGKKSKRKTTKEKNFFRDYISLFVILILWALVYFPIFTDKIDLNGDNVSYYCLGKSINSFKGYVLPSEPEATPHSHFPPGYPTIIALAMFISQDIGFIKLINGFLFLGALYLFYFICRRLKISEEISLLTIGLILLNYHFLNSAVIMMSEIPFLFFSFWSLYLLLRIPEKEIHIRDLVLPILVFGFTFHIRTQGIALLFAAIFLFLYRKQYKALGIFTGGFVLTMLPWMIRNKIQDVGSSYLGSMMKVNPYRPELGDITFSGFFVRIWENIIRYISKELPNGFFPFMNVNYKDTSPLLYFIVGGLIVLITILGFIFYVKSKSKLAVLGYLLALGGILLMWPQAWYGPRFVLPVLPLLMVIFYYSIYRFIVGWIKKPAIKNYMKIAFPVLMLILLVPSLLSLKTTDIRKNCYKKLINNKQSRYPDAYERYFELAKFVKNQYPSDIVVSARKPRMFYLFSDTYTVGYKRSNDPSVILQDFDDQNVKLVVVEQLGYSSTSLYLAPAINANLNKFRLIQKLNNPDTYLYEYLGNTSD